MFTSLLINLHTFIVQRCMHNKITYEYAYYIYTRIRKTYARYMQNIYFTLVLKKDKSVIIIWTTQKLSNTAIYKTYVLVKWLTFPVYIYLEFMSVMFRTFFPPLPHFTKINSDFLISREENIFWRDETNDYHILARLYFHFFLALWWILKN